MDLLPQVFSDALLLAGLYTLMAVGLSLGFGVLRIINFAQGEMIMLGAYGAFWGLTLLGVDPIISLPVLVVAGFALGWLIFRGFVAKVLDAPHINQILLTFGLALAIQHIAIILWSGNARSATTAYATESAFVGDVLVVYSRLIAFAIATIMVVALIAWLRWSETGRATRAVAENRAAAALMGIDVDRIYAMSFGVSCALSVATGVVVSFILTITPFMGFPMLIKSIAIVILGGLGSIAGTVIGAFVLAFSETFVSYYVPDGAGWAEGIAFLLIIGILILRPRGILGQTVET
ncbi:MAG: branched-chain amino acid ABC transporter permease [Pseudolabrys sp.]|nr:branched-chain amino acid ABC transporter permease [Pseudolabrys sp.]MDP2297027.1 branched-chain amino acid ABC transporter permease [Pseudolabrys sp.]